MTRTLAPNHMKGARLARLEMAALEAKAAIELVLDRDGQVDAISLTALVSASRALKEALR